MPRITMKDIAKKAGISQQAVSQIINNKATMVSQATKDKVMQLVKELNYHPNYMAQSLRSGRRFCIGVAGTGRLAEMDDITTAQIYAGIGEVVENHDHYLLFMPLGSDELARVLLRVGSSMVVDGLIIIVYSNLIQSFTNTVAPALEKARIPFVAIHSNARPLKCHNVGFNAPRAGYLATQHLIEQGYREIGILCQRDRAYGDELYAGYTKALHEAGFKVHDLRVAEVSYSAEDGYRLAKDLIRERVLEAYFVHSDGYAYGLLRALEEAGVRVPDDAAVVGGDDMLKSRHFFTGLTAIDRRFRERGQAAAEMLFKVIDGQAMAKQQTVILEPELVVRNSTRKKER